MAKNYQLKGKNFCGLSCVDQESVIHPETCIENTLMACESNEPFSLKNWILGSASHERELKDSLFEWLQSYYSGNVAFTLEPATASTLGGIKVGQYLNINNGILSVNRDGLNIPNSYELPAASRTWDKEIEEAYYPYNLGGVNIFNEWMGRENLTDEKGISIYPYIEDPENPDSIAYCGSIHFDVEGAEDIEFISPVKYLDDQCIIPDVSRFYLFPVDIIKKGLNDNCLVVNIPENLFSQPIFVGATASLNGNAGLVPAPTTNDRNKVLCGDGTWKNIDTSVEVFTSNTNGLVPAPNSSSTSKYLKSNGEWDELISIYDLPVEFLTATRRDSASTYFAELLEDELNVLSQSGGTKEIRINLLGLLEIVSGETEYRITDILQIYGDMIQQQFSELTYFLNLKISFTFIPKNADRDQIFISSHYLSGTYYTHEYVGTDLIFNSGEPYIEVSNNIRYTLTYEYSISKASANPNLTDRLYNTKISLTQIPVVYTETNIPL